MRTFILILSILSLSAHSEVPDTLRRLAQMKDKESEEFIFLAHKAAIDTRHAAISCLEGKNSSGALKILTLGLQLMPHRSDLKELRNKTLETYIGITQKLEEDPKKNCNILKERYSFLSNFAPDAVIKLKHDSSCVLSDLKPEADILQVPEPRLLKELENEFKADSLIKKNSDFPFEDSLNSSFMLLMALYGEDFKVSCQDFQVDATTKSAQEVEVKAKCSASAFDKVRFAEATTKYCNFLNELLVVVNGNKTVKCTLDGKNHVITTSTPLYTIYERAFDNSAFDDDLPLFTVMNMNAKKTYSTTRPILMEFNHKSFRLGQFPKMSFHQGDLNTEASFTMTQDELKGLQELSFTINYKATYQIYKDHFEKSTLADVQCHDIQHRLKLVEESRKKKSLKKSFEKSCPSTGSLSNAIETEFTK